MEDVLFFQRMQEVHLDSPDDIHAKILFHDTKIGELDFYSTFLESVEKTQTPISNWKHVFRAQRIYQLAKYFDYSLKVEGERIECGVLKGLSARVLAAVARMRNTDFSGEHFHVVDSFQGLSAPTIEDVISTSTDADGQEKMQVGGYQGQFATPLEHVQWALSEYPDISFHAGWIPEVFNKIPEKKYAFLHIDVDLYEPTRACLEYFWPRLSRGGVIVNDDYRAPMFPGCAKAWDEFCEAQNLNFHVLTTGQAALIKA